jgi:hypothetical protein
VPATDPEGASVTCPAGSYELTLDGIYSTWPAPDTEASRFGQWRSRTFVYQDLPGSIPHGVSPVGANAPINPWREIGAYEGSPSTRENALASLRQLTPTRFTLARATKLTFVTLDEAPERYGDNREGVVITLRPKPDYTPKRGINFELGRSTDETLDRLQHAAELRPDILRVGVSWRLLEPQQGQWDHRFYIPLVEQVVREASSRGMQVFFLFAESPCWASSASATSMPPKDCSTSDTFKWHPPVRDDDYATALRYLGQYLASKNLAQNVIAWEIWNEPNLPQFWRGAPRNKVEATRYVRLLQKAYPAIKAVNSEAKVLAGSLSNTDIEYLNWMYEAQARNYYDAIAVHPYTEGHAPDECWDALRVYECGVDRLRLAMRDAPGGPDTSPIWLTEFGWSSSDVAPGVGIARQAEYLAHAFDLAGYWTDVPVAVWYDLVDRTDGDRPADNAFGIFDGHWQPKLAASRFAQAPLMCSPRPRVLVQSASQGDGRLRITLTATSNLGTQNTLMGIVWNALNNASVEGLLGATPGNQTSLNSVPSATFFVRPSVTGASATVQLAVIDGCGSWPTFVGGGPNVFR